MNEHRTVDRLRAKFALCCIAGSFVVNLAAMVRIIYCAFESEWLPAILILARKDLVGWMDRTSDRLATEMEATK